jgi:exosome complex RNA-binding protein Rrp42 (RNase PH superfamily)
LADAGNLLDCACLAGIVALKHFRRPDVEVIGDEVTVVRLFLVFDLFLHFKRTHAGDNL